MNWLSSAGFDAYVGLGIASRVELHLPSHTVASRLIALRQLVRPQSVHQRVVDRYLSAWDAELWDFFEEDYLGEDGFEWNGWSDERHERYAPSEANVEGIYPSPLEQDTATSTKPRSASESREPLILQLRTFAGPLSRVWDFHKGDVDPYPSVPHGHAFENGHANMHPKLDAYRGYIFDSAGDEVGRETKQAIISLWNDDRFRVFAFEALQHRMEVDPTFRNRLQAERGISNPLHLPFRRK